MRELIASHPAAPTPPRDGVARRAAIAALMMLACVTLAACGDSEPSDQAAATTTAAKAAYPVTIASKHGSVTLTSKPVRVVTLDNQATDDALALGVTPVGMVALSYVPGKIQTWTKAALAGKPAPALIATDKGLPFERIAALRPDVILATNTYELEEKKTYTRLSKIAPTIHFVKGSLTDSWQEAMGRVGQTLGQPDRASELIADVEGQVAEVRKRTPEFESKIVNFFIMSPPQGLYAISDPQDLSMQFMAELGMKLSPAIAALPPSKSVEAGRAQISPERYDLLKSDLLVGTAFTTKILDDLAADKLFKRLDVVRDGGYVPLEIGPSTSMAFPSLLSIRYALTDVVPQFEAAIKKAAAS